jgi:hypothetical protein
MRILLSLSSFGKLVIGRLTDLKDFCKNKKPTTGFAKGRSHNWWNLKILIGQ